MNYAINSLKQFNPTKVRLFLRSTKLFYNFYAFYGIFLLFDLQNHKKGDALRTPLAV